MMFFNNFGKERKIIGAMRHMQIAIAFLSEGRYEAAIQEYKVAIDKYPIKENGDKDKFSDNDHEFFKAIHNMLGAAYYGKAKDSKETDPERRELFELALKGYKNILDHKPTDEEAAEVYNNIGACYGFLGDLDASIESRKKSLDYKPDYPEVYVNLGICYEMQNKFDLAILAYDNAITIKKGNYAEAYYSRGLAYSKIGKLQEAISDYDNAIKNKVNYHRAYHNCGLLYSAQGNHKKAIRYFIDALVYSENNEDMALTHNYFAVSLAKTEKWDLALIHFHEALRMASNSDFKKRVENNIEFMKRNSISSLY
jgi:tetratricopeptide (TPR) repeat protein